MGGVDGVGSGGGTLVLAPDECLLHLTAPEPMQRGAPSPPPENVERLRVLTHPGGLGGLDRCRVWGARHAEGCA